MSVLVLEAASAPRRRGGRAVITREDVERFRLVGEIFEAPADVDEPDELGPLD